LNAAYGDGLLSETTLIYRLDTLLTTVLIDPVRLIGDLTRRAPRRAGLAAARQALAGWFMDAFASSVRRPRERTILLALDWSGGSDELLIGRGPSCDVVLPGTVVSRRHARLLWRDGGWILRDLESLNGTIVNGTRVTRCRLEPGDELVIGGHTLSVD
jgi:FHA domain